MAVFNLSSSSVRGALFYTQSSGIPRIVFSVDRSLDISEQPEAPEFHAKTIAALASAAEGLYKAGLGSPKKVFCTLSAPWYLSQTRTIKFRKSSPFIFTEKFADDLISKEIKIFQEEYAKKFGKEDNAVRPIELKNIKTLLNGYESENPLGQKAKEAEMFVFVSVSGETMLRSVEETIGRYFSGNIKFSSFAMSSFAVVRDLYSKEDNFLLLDIGGEITEIFMSKKGILRDSISFPMGKNFLLRGTASKLGSTLHEAVSLLSLFKDGHAEESVAKRMNEVVSKLKYEWLEKFQSSLANLSKDISIPSALYIVVDEDMADFFSEIIKSEQFSQYTLTESKFNSTFLTAESLHSMAQFDEKAVPEPFIAIDCVYINRFLARI